MLTTVLNSAATLIMIILGSSYMSFAWAGVISSSAGFFARIWCQQELAAHGLDTEIARESLSFNRHRGTVRGLHFQQPPHEEIKIVRCTRGGIFDVIVDLRPRSPSYLRWQGFELTAENRRALYVPKGFAHGSQLSPTMSVYPLGKPRLALRRPSATLPGSLCWRLRGAIGARDPEEGIGYRLHGVLTRYSIVLGWVRDRLRQRRAGEDRFHSRLR